MTSKEQTDKKAGGIDLNALVGALEALEPSVQDLKKRAFEHAYPFIAKQLKQGRSEGDIIKILAREGVLKSRNTYTKWMVEMKEKHGEDPKEPSESLLQRLNR